MLRNEELNN